MFSIEFVKLIRIKSSALSPKLVPGTRATPFSFKAISANFFPLSPVFDTFGKA